MEHKENEGKNLLTYTEAGAVLSVSESQIRRYVQDGKLTFEKIGHRCYITKESLQKLAKKSRVLQNSTESRWQPSRREILVTAGKVLLAGVSGWAFILWKKLKDEKVNEEVSVEHIFPFWKDIQLIPGESHPVYGFHPDVEDAQRRIVSMMQWSGTVKILTLENLPAASIYRDLLLVGGPISNRLSMILHGFRFFGKKISVNPQKDIGTRWYFHYPYPNKDDKAYLRYVDGELRKNWPKALGDKKGVGSAGLPLFVKIDPDTERILSDYLLITVVPNTFSKDSTGSTVIDVADLYGQGDKAFGTILGDRELRAELDSARKEKRYFQVLYEVPVSHDEKSRISTPGKPILRDVYRLG